MVDVNSMEWIWNHTFSEELRSDPSDFNVLLTDTFDSNPMNRLKMTEIMFETFRVKGFYVQIAQLLSLFSYGKTTGCVVDLGDGACQAVPCYEGTYIKDAVKKSETAGKSISEFLMDNKMLGYEISQ